MEMNGGSVIAMTGKDCVAIASDLRLGNGAVGLTADFEKVSGRASERVSEWRIRASVGWVRNGVQKRDWRSVRGRGCYRHRVTRRKPHTPNNLQIHRPPPSLPSSSIPGYPTGSTTPPTWTKTQPPHQRPPGGFIFKGTLSGLLNELNLDVECWRKGR